MACRLDGIGDRFRIRAVDVAGVPAGGLEAGDLVIPIREGAIDAAHIAGELGDVFGGRTPGDMVRKGSI